MIEGIGVLRADLFEILKSWRKEDPFPSSRRRRWISARHLGYLSAKQPTM